MQILPAIIRPDLFSIDHVSCLLKQLAEIGLIEPDLAIFSRHTQRVSVVHESQRGAAVGAIALATMHGEALTHGAGGLHLPKFYRGILASRRQLSPIGAERKCLNLLQRSMLPFL